MDILVGAVDPAQVAKDWIDSLTRGGYYLARVQSTRPRGIHHPRGRRPPARHPRVEIVGNKALPAKTIVGHLDEARGVLLVNGEFDSDKYAEDLAKTIPALYAQHGYIDMSVVRDTMIIDREKGKALVRITVNEGPQYKLGDFEVNGAKRFSAEEIARMYPFTPDKSKGLGQTVKGLIGRGAPEEKDVFNEAAWEDATGKVREAYANEGYIYASIQPVVERRRVGPDSLPKVDLRWEIDEKTPAIVNRIDIVGNDVTVETCIRDQLFILPGTSSIRAASFRHRNIANLGFGRMEPPTTTQANDQGDINLVFHVNEHRTGNVTFGASVGQGTRVRGFIGFDQPNLFGECKRVSLQ